LVCELSVHGRIGFAPTFDFGLVVIVENDLYKFLSTLNVVTNLLEPLSLLKLTQRRKPTE